MRRAACAGKAPDQKADPDARDPWFPGKGHSHNTGKIICFTCPVRAECEDYRVRTNSTHGIWAGKLAKPEDEEDV